LSGCHGILSFGLKQIKYRWWVHDINRNWLQQGAYRHLVKEPQFDLLYGILVLFAVYRYLLQYSIANSWFLKNELLLIHWTAFHALAEIGTNDFLNISVLATGSFNLWLDPPRYIPYVSP